MIDILSQFDTILFHFGNSTLANPVSDVLMPILTDLNRTWWGLTLYALGWLWLVTKGGRRGRIAAVLLILLIVSSDQISSSLVKKMIARPRPCHEINGMVIVQNIHLLVNCGSGMSFPSSHATNNFAAASLLTYFYPRQRWYFFLYAGLIGFTRIAVGVHYPSDIIGGALLGILCAALVLLVWKAFSRAIPAFDLDVAPDTLKPPTPV